MNKLILSFISGAFVCGIPNLAYSAGAALPNFQTVVPDQFYRGGVPSKDGLTELKRMGVYTVFNVRDEDPLGISIEEDRVRELGMNFVSLPLNTFSPPPPERMASIARILQDERYHPIYLHCTHGKDRTGLIAALYRVFVQRWSPQRAYKEMISLGFRTYLVYLKNYFEERTGYPHHHGQFFAQEPRGFFLSPSDLDSFERKEGPIFSDPSLK